MNIEPIGVVRKTSEEGSTIEIDARHVRDLGGISMPSRMYE